MDRIRRFIKEIEEVISQCRAKMKDADSEDFLVMVYMFTLSQLGKVVQHIMVEDRNKVIPNEIHTFLSNKISNSACDAYEIFIQEDQKFGGQCLKNPKMVELLQPQVLMDSLLQTIAEGFVHPIPVSINPSFIIRSPEEVQ